MGLGQLYFSVEKNSYCSKATEKTHRKTRDRRYIEKISACFSLDYGGAGCSLTYFLKKNQNYDLSLKLSKHVLMTIKDIFQIE